MTTKFKLPKPTKDDAVWFEVIKDGETYGKFKAKHQDPSSPSWQLNYRRALNALTKGERFRADNPKTEADILLRRNLVIRMFVEHYVTDSKMVDADDKEMAHSTQNVLDLLLMPEAYFIFQELDEYSSDEAYYRYEPVAETKKN